MWGQMRGMGISGGCREGKYHTRGRIWGVQEQMWDVKGAVWPAEHRGGALKGFWFGLQNIWGSFHRLLPHNFCLPSPENRLLPTELRRQALALQKELEFETPGENGE